MDWVCLIAILSKFWFICRLDDKSFSRNVNPVLRFIWKYKRPGIDKTILKREKEQVPAALSYSN